MHEMKAGIANIANLYRLDGIIPSTKPQTYDNIFPPGLAAHSSVNTTGMVGNSTPRPGTGRMTAASTLCVCAPMYACLHLIAFACVLSFGLGLFFGFANHHKLIGGNHE